MHCSQTRFVCFYRFRSRCQILHTGRRIYSWSFPKLWRDPFLRQDLTVHFSQIERDHWLWSNSCRHRPLERTHLDFVVVWFSDRRDSVNISFDKINPSVILPSSVQTCFGPSMLSGTWILCYGLLSYLDVPVYPCTTWLPLIEIIWQLGHCWVIFLCKLCKGTSWSVVKPDFR
jgi:hypothetical protein